MLDKYNTALVNTDAGGSDIIDWSLARTGNTGAKSMAGTGNTSASNMTGTGYTGSRSMVGTGNTGTNPRTVVTKMIDWLIIP